MMLLGNSTITRIRRAAGTNVKGKYVPGAETRMDIPRCSVQPLKPREVESLPERLQEGAEFKLYAAHDIDLRLSGGLPDLVEYGGEVYRVYALSTYPNGLIRHGKWLLVRPRTTEEHPDGVRTA